LRWVNKQSLESEAITAGIEAEMLDDPSEGFEGVLGHVSVFPPAT